MKTGLSQRTRRHGGAPDHAKTRTSQEPATINQQPSMIRGEAQNTSHLGAWVGIHVRASGDAWSGWGLVRG